MKAQRKVENKWKVKEELLNEEMLAINRRIDQKTRENEKTMKNLIEASQQFDIFNKDNILLRKELSSCKKFITQNQKERENVIKNIQAKYELKLTDLC